MKVDINSIYSFIFTMWLIMFNVCGKTIEVSQKKVAVISLAEGNEQNEFTIDMTVDKNKNSPSSSYDKSKSDDESIQEKQPNYI